MLDDCWPCVTNQANQVGINNPCLLSPSVKHITVSPGDDDCEVDERGTFATLYCPYLSVLMEHCYTCFSPEVGEYVICDGWEEREIRAQCASSTPLPSPGTGV